jgi:hypothetical protein
MVKRSAKKKQPDNVNPDDPSVRAKLTDEMARAPKLIRRAQQLSIDFLKVELETGLTFASVARTSADPPHKEQARSRALEAYDTLLQQLPKVNASIVEKQRSEEKLKQLEQALKQLEE